MTQKYCMRFLKIDHDYLTIPHLEKFEIPADIR